MGCGENWSLKDILWFSDFIAVKRGVDYSSRNSYVEFNFVYISWICVLFFSIYKVFNSLGGGLSFLKSNQTCA